MSALLTFQESIASQIARMRNFMSETGLSYAISENFACGLGT
jgi:hypothetical protein